MIPVDGLADPMCLLFLIHELQDIPGTLDKEESDDIRRHAVSRLLKHVQRDGSLILETVSPEGEELSGVEGRKMIPGHAIECGWFLLKEYQSQGGEEMKKKALENFIENPFRYGWDEKHGGLLYFLDSDGTVLILKP